MIIDRITFARLRERLSFLCDPVFAAIKAKDGQDVEIRRSSFQIEGGGVMYMVTFTVMPEGQRRADTPRFSKLS